MVWATAPATARAQAYVPNFPVCQRTYGFAGDNIDCSYTSLPQCNAAASGRAAQCLINPFFAHPTRKPVGRMGYRWYAPKAHRTTAKAFVCDMRAYFAEKDGIKRDEIAIRQLVVLNEYLGRRERPLRVIDVREMFAQMRDVPWRDF
jgi:Protein of unknown function (DUF3551)